MNSRETQSQCRHSIPYGAIKSDAITFIVYIQIIISIPYGAIKTTLTYSELTYLKKISITYGAIKIPCTYPDNEKGLLFQFLMVRLKESQFLIY